LFLRRIECRRTEVRDVALWPMDLEEVDVVDLQARQAGVGGLGDDLAREIRPTATDPVAPPRAGDLARDDHSLAPAAREPATEDRLGAPLRLRVGRHGIHLGGINEVDAL